MRHVPRSASRARWSFDGFAAAADRVQPSLDAIFNGATPRSAEPNEVIFSAGDSGESMFFVLEGKAVPKLHDGRSVKTWPP